MKNRGLQNRFSDKIRSAWVGWYECLFCGKNNADALHHILSPSTSFYIHGKHNTSIFNSCPIANLECHIGNEAKLFTKKQIVRLLKEVRAIVKVELCYTLVDVDIQFLKVYEKLYNE